MVVHPARHTILFVLLMLGFVGVHAQCPIGQVEVGFAIRTDSWGYEGYWELHPKDSLCGDTLSRIAFGGNIIDVGCDGAGGGDASPSNGYSSSQTINVGPWCLTRADSFDIIAIDDFYAPNQPNGDGGTDFRVFAGGNQIEYFESIQSSHRFRFEAGTLPENDLSLNRNLTDLFVDSGSHSVRAVIRNNGTDTVFRFDFCYQIDSSDTICTRFDNLSMAYKDSMVFEHPVALDLLDTGAFLLMMWVDSLNDSLQDVEPRNDSLLSVIQVSNAIPNILYGYITEPTDIQTLATASDGLDFPRDLAFHPQRSRRELWVINRDAEADGGSTLTLFNAGEENQSSLWRRDGNAYHFMALPTALDFGRNGNWASSPGILDANHVGGSYTGPTLWSSDSSIYSVIGNPATPTFNGSHLDMLHGSPYAVGITYSHDNVYYVFDAYNSQIVRYSFTSDHGPGQHDHSNGEVVRFEGLNLERHSDSIPSHLVFDESIGRLYIADAKNGRVLYLDVYSGADTLNLPLINEPLSIHQRIEGAEWGVLYDDIQVPTGIAILEDRMIVSDAATGNIHLLRIDDLVATRLFSISTNADLLLGINIGPDGFIYFVDAINNSVHKMVMDPPSSDMTSLTEVQEEEWDVYPNPSDGIICLNVRQNTLPYSLDEVRVYDGMGRTVKVEILGDQCLEIQFRKKGLYWIKWFGESKPILLR
ncbi:MAG TPA: hypothetical protein DCF84_09200 [Bacteroidetes bacterium]|nr:hypothetical protein [Bacteroidota bacterium]